MIALGSAATLLLQTDSPVWFLLILSALTGLGFGAFEWTISASIVGSFAKINAWLVGRLFLPLLACWVFPLAWRFGG